MKILYTENKHGMCDFLFGTEHTCRVIAFDWGLDIYDFGMLAMWDDQFRIRYIAL